MAEMRRPVTGRKGDEESTASGEGNGSASEGEEDLAARQMCVLPKWRMKGRNTGRDVPG